MNYVDFNYYKDVFLGTLITDENLFNKLYNQAELQYDNYTRKQKMTDYYLSKPNDKPAKAIKFTLCEMIENINKFDKLLDLSKETDEINAQGIKSESIKSRSLSFSDSKQLKSSSLKNELINTNISIMNQNLSVHGLLYRGL